jgi:DMSO/TMAO reductase YedYZ molybdopterin-dependent catalytic subunit
MAWSQSTQADDRRPANLGDSARRSSDGMRRHTRAAHFGMISVGDWTGIRISDILTAAKTKSSATQVLISGFDRYVGNLSRRHRARVGFSSWTIF